MKIDRRVRVPGEPAGAQQLTRRTVLKGTGAAFAAGTAGTFLQACGGGASSGSEEFTFLAVVPFTSLTFAPEMFADAAGYFADVGIPFEAQSTRGSAQAVQLVLSGGAPLTRIGQIEAVSHIANREAPIVNVSTVVKESTIRIVSSTADPLEEPADFEGKLIGIPSEGGESETTLDLLLASAGIDGASVERQVVGVGPGVFDLVRQGRIAAFIVSIDTANILANQTDEAVLLRPGDFIDAGSQLYMTSADQYETNRDRVSRYLQAIRAAIDFIVADDGFDRTLETIRSKYDFGTLSNTVVAKASLGEYVRAWTIAGDDLIMRTNAARWQAGYDELVSAGLIEGGLNPDDWFTNELAPSA